MKRQGLPETVARELNFFRAVNKRYEGKNRLDHRQLIIFAGKPKIEYKISNEPPIHLLAALCCCINWSV